MTRADCVYCEEYKRVKLWSETYEYVCFDCRASQLDQEFNNEVSFEKAICLYCGEFRPLKVWSETQELVCYDCRNDQLDQEFNGDGDFRAQEQMEREVILDF